ncbi:hypothetical protein [Haloplanus sp. C73]|uniref:hypothetical protein n=1 Tax=Haloplanus sp. C73 TaxID=3421641 RepID=UPI003EB8BA30
MHEDSATELSWDFPTASDEAGYVGYVELAREPQFDAGDPTPTAGFHVNASVDPSSGYTLDRFTLRLSTPETYHQRHGDVQYLAEPPATSGAFRTRYRRYPTRREFVVALRDAAVDGTLQFPLLVRDADTLPSALRCSVSLAASESGPLGSRLRISETGSFEFGAPEGQT